MLLLLSADSNNVLVSGRDKVFSQLNMFKHLSIWAGSQHRYSVLDIRTEILQKLPGLTTLWGNHQMGKPKQLGKPGCILGNGHISLAEVLKFIFFFSRMYIGKKFSKKVSMKYFHVVGEGRISFFSCHMCSTSPVSIKATMGTFYSWIRSRIEKSFLSIESRLLRPGGQVLLPNWVGLVF